MLLTGLPVTAEEGLRMGLVSKVSKENELGNKILYFYFLLVDMFLLSSINCQLYIN